MDNEEEQQQQPEQEQSAELPIDATPQPEEAPAASPVAESVEPVVAEETPPIAPEPQPAPLLPFEDLLKAEFDAVKARIASLETAMTQHGHSISSQGVGQMVETVIGELERRVRTRFGGL